MKANRLSPRFRSLTIEYFLQQIHCRCRRPKAGKQHFRSIAPSDGALLVGIIPELLSGRVVTGSGDNDTSVADKVGAVRGVPGDGESPMRTVSCRSSAESPAPGCLR